MGMLENQVALVTGAASGLGRAIAGRFAGEGAAVVMADRDQGRLACAVGEIPSAAAVELDVTEHEAARSMVRAAAERYGRLDVAVNAVGRFARQRTAEVEAVEWDTMMAVNLKARSSYARRRAR